MLLIQHLLFGFTISTLWLLICFSGCYVYAACYFELVFIMGLSRHDPFSFSNTRFFLSSGGKILPFYVLSTNSLNKQNPKEVKKAKK